MRDHIHTLGLFQQPGVEALREPGDDPYDFKEGDIEYTFSTSKRLKGQGREPSKKAKVGLEICSITQKATLPEGAFCAHIHIFIHIFF